MMPVERIVTKWQMPSDSLESINTCTHNRNKNNREQVSQQFHKNLYSI